MNFWTSYDLEADWDYAFVEAHPVGSDDWTTLPETNGHTQQGTGDSTFEGWHKLYTVPGALPDRGDRRGRLHADGTAGNWHAASGNSNGWQEWSIDLSQYAGQQVEVSIAYASDWGTQGLGAFVDDTSVLVDGVEQSATSFETEDMGGWTVSGAPPGSEPNNNDWQRDQAFEEGAVVVTEDTVYAGFGAEGLSPAQRDDFVARSLQHLLD